MRFLHGLLAGAVLCLLAATTPAAAAGGDPVAGTLSSSGQSATFSPYRAAIGIPFGFDVSLWGTFSASCALERTFDGGTTWLPITFSDGSALTWSGPMSTDITEYGTGVLYRLNCTVSSGTVNYRLNQ